MKISVFGTGYVGLVTGVCFAEMGNDVLCMDIDESKINGLREGKSPIYEQNIEEFLHRNSQERRLLFTTNSLQAVEQSEMLFIAVGTPPREDGSADLSYVCSLAKTIGEQINSPKTIVTKSTVPVGTNKLIRQIIHEEMARRKVNFAIEIVSNPEFLREGTAIEECLNPDRIIVGVESEKAQKIMRRLYEPFVKNGAQFIAMDLASAELTKYAANCMLAAKISIMNEFSRLCDRLGADIEKVRVGLGADHRIGPHFIYAGIGYGGSCFPKDVNALIHLGDTNGENLKILKSVSETNVFQRERFVERVLAQVKNKKAKIAVWGVAFKPGTDDIRDAPAIYAMSKFVKAGHEVVAFDPVAEENTLREIKSPNLKFSPDQYQTLEGADLLCVFTEWKSFREPDFAKMKNLLKVALIFDGRNIWDTDFMKENGFNYLSIGRP